MLEWTDSKPIRFNLCAEVHKRRVFDEVYVPIARIVYEDVEATEGFDRYIDGVLGLRFVRDVERNGSHTLSKLASYIDEMLRIAGRGWHPPDSLRCCCWFYLRVFLSVLCRLPFDPL